MQLFADEYDSWYYTKKGKYISGLEKRVLLKMIQLSAISYQSSAIDIGCGTGYFTQFLGNYCRSVVGVDTSMDMIKYAMIKYKDSNIKYLIANAESLPFKERSFDISVSVTAVNFFKNPARAVSESVRISRKKIFLGVLNRWSMLSFFKKLKGIFKDTSYSDACFYSQREITNILSTVELPLPSGERVGVRGIHKQHTYFLPFPRIRLVLSGFERIIPSWIPFGGFMGIAGER
ncbi:MAG: methyltransferase domain-containing protein [Nitrospinae bacterium]|nr:methyltransferase domain-containing protein [Nitrospinota bacterium]